MMQVIQSFRWPLFLAYVVAGAVALLLATPIGLSLLGQPLDSLSFIPATVIALPWSLLTLVFRDDSVTTLAVLGIGYALNVGVGLMLARDGGDSRLPGHEAETPGEP